MAPQPSIRAILAVFGRGRRAKGVSGGLPVALLSGLLVAASVGAPAGAQTPGALAATYFLSCHGSDKNSGTSRGAPWLTLAKVSEERYHAGDRILLQRNCVWTGTFIPRSSGTGAAPIAVSAYGSGVLPRIVGQDAPAVALHDVSGWTIENLDLTQIGQKPQPLDTGNQTGSDLDPNSDRVMKAVVDVRAFGARGVSDCGTSCTDSDITLQDLVVHDGQWDGIYVGAGDQNAAEEIFGYIDRLTIQDVESRGNQSGGIVMAGTFTKNVIYEMQNVRVLDSLVDDNGGNGLVMGQVDHALIQGNRCAYNGRIRNASNGCWSWDSKDVTIQLNEADHNMTPLTNGHTSDGGGFGLDMGSIDGVMQYNWSHDNQGEGYLLESFPIGYGYKCCPSRNVTVRYNVSERDGQKDSGAIEIFGGVTSAWIYNNTVYHVSPRSDDGLFHTGGDLVSTTFRKRAGLPRVAVDNNLFISDGTLKPSVDTEVDSDGYGSFRFDHNMWEQVDGRVRFQWGTSDVTDWSSWQALGFDADSTNTDIRVTGSLGGGPTSYQLSAGSPAIGAAADVAGAPKGMGGRDYFGTSVPQVGRYDVGAAEYAGVDSKQESNARPVLHQDVAGASHVASISVTDSSGAPRSTLPRGSVLYWRVKVTNAEGAPLSGQSVTTTVYDPSWSSIYATVTATTDASGTAKFTHTTASGDVAGTYFMFLSQVQPRSTSGYYDSSKNTAWTSSFTLR
jgi:hypothetical protein